MGVFEFVIVLVLISTVGKVLSQRLPRERSRSSPPQIGPGEVEGIREAIDELSSRVIRLEEERDFYRQLLEAPEPQREIRPPGPDLGSDDTEPTP